jgi:uncharacterized protein YbjT (DUF2867 family)
MPVILITGGNGRTARHLIELLLNHPDCPALRVLVRRGGVEPVRQAFPLLTLPPHDILKADYMDERSLTPAFRDATMVIHNGPSVHQQETVRRSFYSTLSPMLDSQPQRRL